MTIRRSLFWSMSQQFGMMALQLLNMVVIARLLTPEEIGVFVIALSIVTIIQALREMGLSNYLIREPVLHDKTIRAVFGMSLALCAVLGLGLFAGRYQFEAFMGTPGIAAVLGPVVLSILIFPIEQPATGLLRRDMRFDVLARASITAKFIGVMTSIVLALLGFSTMSLAYGLLAESVMSVVLLCRVERRHLTLGPGIRGWRPLLSFGAWTSGAALAGKATVEGNKLLVGAILGAGSTAFFDRAARIPGIVRNGLFKPLGSVLLSSFSEDLRQGRDIGPKVGRVTAITTGMVWPTFAVIAILADEIVALMLGPQWGMSATILPWLLLAQGTLSLLPQPEQILVPHGAVRRLFWLRICQIMTSLGISYVTLTVTVGSVEQIEVFAWGRPLNAVIFISVIWISVRNYMGVRLREIFAGHLKSGLMALTAAAPVAAWKYAGLGGGSYVALVLSMLLAAALGLGLGFVLHHPLVLELKTAATWVLRRRSRSDQTPN